MPSVWNLTKLELPETSKAVILDSIEGQIFGALNGKRWFLDISPANKPVHCGLGCFPYWRYPTVEELSERESLKKHNQAALETLKTQKIK